MLRNAIRHTPAGGAIRLRLERDGDAALIVVSDSGSGVPPGDLQRIVEPFIRLGPGSEGNSGLGLAIAARAIELHGGSISASNSGTDGLAVTIRLPLA